MSTEAHPGLRGHTLHFLHRGEAPEVDVQAGAAGFVEAHLTLDQCYRKQPFASDRERAEFLFRLYEELTAPLATAAAEKKHGRKAKAQG